MITELAKLLIVLGVSITVVGVLLFLAVRYLPWLGNLPGDVQYESENLKVYAPFATMILISIVGTILLNVVVRIFRR